MSESDWTDRRNLLPPRKKDWKKGTTQVGVFIRTKEGSVIQFASDQASRAEAALVLCVIKSPKKMPKQLVADLCKWVDENTDDILEAR